MKLAMQAASSTVKVGVGVGLSTVFVATMDDVIYSTFRKNVIMPFQMVSIKGSAGEVPQREDIKGLAKGTGDFIKEM